MNRLANGTLHQLPSAVARPLYDRSTVQTGIVHLGVGAFHRAHQAAFTDDCLNAGETGWGITAASLRSPATRDALAPQDSLYCLALRENDDQALRVVGAIGQVLVAPHDPAALLSAMTNPAVRIISLTITEKGYTADVASGDLHLTHADVQHDLRHPTRPRTALGYLVQALALRRMAGVAPFTVLSCDNLPGNGHLLGRALAQFATARDADLGLFVANELASPSCMVDRIVPATTDPDRALISAALGLQDAWPVLAEPFGQWVIEDRFPTGRPSWERAGVDFVTDVAPFETMKLRLLNGAHTTIAAMGRVSGHDTVAAAIANPVIRSFITALWAEVAPTISSGIDQPSYTRRLLARFDNAALQHKTAQIATDASLKVPQRLLAPLRDLAAMGRPTPILGFALAAWIRSCQGPDDAGRPMTLADPALQSSLALPGAQVSPAETVARFMAHAPVFGPTPDPALAVTLQRSLTDIQTLGLLPAARKCLASQA